MEGKFRTIVLSKPFYILWILLYLASCQSYSAPTKQIIDTMDLLITVSDMPNGWEYREEPSDVTDIYVNEASAVTFIAPIEGPGNLATVKVSRYDKLEFASRIFKVQYHPSISDPLPEEWLPFAISADQYSLMCFKRPEPFLPYCIWGAQYGEYVVDINTTIIPSFMSLEDLGTVIEALDTRMVNHLRRQMP